MNVTSVFLPMFWPIGLAGRASYKIIQTGLGGFPHEAVWICREMPERFNCKLRLMVEVRKPTDRGCSPIPDFC